MQTFAFYKLRHRIKAKKRISNWIDAQLEILLPSWGAITATELILFYYEKVKYKLKKV